MRTISLNGAWTMRAAQGDGWFHAVVPGTVYQTLMNEGRMDDPFYRDNELNAFELMNDDYIYRRHFPLTAEDLRGDALLLEFEGLDTLAAVTLNEAFVGRCDNMHRSWTFDVKHLAKEGPNTLEVRLSSPLKYIREAYRQVRADGSSDATEGFPHLRKAHYMFGWDWGARLPDAGIFRGVKVHVVDRARLSSVRVHQAHADGRVTLDFTPEINSFTGLCACGEDDFSVKISVTAPDGRAYVSDGSPILIDEPALWWPNGYGAQPLYEVSAALCAGGREVDRWRGRIGLRTLTMRREKDQWGESFATEVNGVQIFAMGADYIPEDNLLGRVTPERTRLLLTDAALAHFNAIRVWGGGYYPDDWFYDICDELGLVVWQDFMFACAVYELTDAFEDNIRHEVFDNARRLRHHASLGLWCGNNEMEQFVAQGLWVNTPKQKADYIRMFEYIIPKALRTVDPDTFYWPASPSSGGGFDNPNDENRGDVHYWDVWHGGKPFTEYRKFFFRYASEFGFQSFPSMKTIESFTLPGDRNAFSYVMEKHQRNDAANGKILAYLAQTFLYPGTLDLLSYASQLLQMEAIRCGVEHWRRHRGRCMGAIYWQLNDCWPVASWASIDYFGRWKALHYAAKRFFAPVLLSCQEEGVSTQNANVNAEPNEVVKSMRLNVSNETMDAVRAHVRWALRAPDASVIESGEQAVFVPALSARWLDERAFPEAPLRAGYVSYDLFLDGAWVSGGTALFCPPKHFEFLDPRLTLSVNGDEITVAARAYAKGVEILCDDGDCLFSDNFFDLNADSRTVKILRGAPTRFSVRSVYDIR
ncbi:glycosyl hydrolase 2 galactose-binding domain-containing protein [Bacillota bacterium Meth-B3]